MTAAGKRAIGVLLGLVLAGCASAIPSGTGTGPDAAALRQDSFLSYDEVQTEVLHTAAADGKTSMALIARRDRTNGALTMHALVGVSYVGLNLRRYESARNQKTVALPLHSVRRVGPTCRSNTACVHSEIYRVDIPEADLRAALAAGQGYPLKLYTHAGAGLLFPTTREQVAGLFRIIGSWPSTAKAAAASAAAKH